METKPLQTDWEFVADTVMGGISEGTLTTVPERSPAAVRLQGQVSLDNNGGFIQAAADLGALNASDWQGIMLDVAGNAERYDLRLRTSDLTRPWQSHRMEFEAPKSWQSLIFPFSEFVPHKTFAKFNASKLRRIGVVAIGREFEADISIDRVALYR